MSSKELLDQLALEVSKAVSDFQKAIPSIEKGMMDRVSELVTRLEVSRGNVKSSLNNVRIAQQIDSALDSVLVTPEYQKAIVAYGRSFSRVTDLSDKYYTSVLGQFQRPEIINAIRSIAINNVVDSLAGSGLKQNVTSRVRSVIETGITSRSSFFDLNEALRFELMGDMDSAGLLARYSKTITNDALFEYSSAYDRQMTQEYDFEWFEYVGSLIDDSRDLCVALVEKQYIHTSEIPEIIRGNVDGVAIPINPRTGLPRGMKEETNEDNFQQLRGGWGCKHRMIGVLASFVPKDIREKFE